VTHACRIIRNMLLEARLVTLGVLLCWAVLHAIKVPRRCNVLQGIIKYCAIQVLIVRPEGQG